LILAALAALAVSSPVLAEEPPAEWAAALPPMGWKPLYGTSQAAVFVRDMRTIYTGHRTMWVRTEFKQGATDGTLSWVEFNEYDCARGRFRVLQQHHFSGQNLSGANRGPFIHDWANVIPQSISDDELREACATALG
jgi:hypothetical protein